MRANDKGGIAPQLESIHASNSRSLCATLYPTCCLSADDGCTQHLTYTVNWVAACMQGEAMLNRQARPRDPNDAQGNSAATVPMMERAWHLNGNVATPPPVTLLKTMDVCPSK